MDIRYQSLLQTEAVAVTVKQASSISRNPELLAFVSVTDDI